jgi:hypothetical protein
LAINFKLKKGADEGLLAEKQNLNKRLREMANHVVDIN